MNRAARGAGVLALAAIAGACYHATIETGLPAGNETVENSFAAGWIYGLVPPSTVSTAAKCRSGVSKVETQLSFVNLLVGDLTLGIVTPMSIKATCAAAHSALPTGTRELAVRSEATPAVMQAVFETAAEVAAAAPGGVAYVRFTSAAPQQ